MSLPLIPGDTDIDAVLSAANLAGGDASNLSHVHWFDPASGTWKYRMAGLAPTLLTMEDGLGYWINAITADTLTIYGTEAASPSYPVLADWNMIGFTSISDMPLVAYLASVAGNYDVVYRWNAATGTWSYWMAFANDFDTMTPGYGYWLHMIAGGTITPP